MKSAHLYWNAVFAGSASATDHTPLMFVSAMADAGDQLPSALIDPTILMTSLVTVVAVSLNVTVAAVDVGAAAVTTVVAAGVGVTVTGAAGATGAAIRPMNQSFLETRKELSAPAAVKIASASRGATEAVNCPVDETVYEGPLHVVGSWVVSCL